MMCFRINISFRFPVCNIIPRNEIFLSQYKLYKTSETQDKIKFESKEKMYEIKYLYKNNTILRSKKIIIL